MAQTSDELRMDIERTRDEMGDTVEALAHKADVPSRTKEWIGEKKDAVASKVSGATGRVSELTPDGEEVKQTASGLKRTAERKCSARRRNSGSIRSLPPITTRQSRRSIAAVRQNWKPTGAPVSVRS